MHALLQRPIFSGKVPWVFLTLAACAVVIQVHPAWQQALVYDRPAVEHGEIWRIWTGHFVHFGWPHFVADAGLFLILGWLLERRYPVQSYAALLGMPLAIAVALYVGDHDLVRYGGLSGVNFGLLVFLALQGWQRNWIDWFWPAVLAAYLAELVLESTMRHGQGGGAIRFNDSSIRVATMAHVGEGLFGLGLWVLRTTRWITRVRICWHRRAQTLRQNAGQDGA